MESKFLVTGASGYIAMHIIDMLLNQGYYVRGTIRNLNDKEKVDALKKLGPIELVEADLENAESWKTAVKGIDIVLHVASPVPFGNSLNSEQFIKQAVDGTLNVLRASLEEGVKRVVVTSSGLTVVSGSHIEKNKTYSEDDWVDPKTISPSFPFAGYETSKIMSERAAWEFYEEHKKQGKCFELATILPTFVIGPISSAFNVSSVSVFARAFDKSVEKVMASTAPLCDVRDVALAHLRAAQLDEAVGHRFIISSTPKILSTIEVFEIMREAGYEMTRIEDRLDKSTFESAKIDNTKMRTILKIEPTDLKKSVLDMAESFVKYGIAKK